MFPIAAAVTWFGYGTLTWGWVLVKGYNIPFLDWMNPVHPYQWPSGAVPLIPAGSEFPTATTAAATSSTSSGKKVATGPLTPTGLPQTPQGLGYPYGAAGPPGGG